MLSGVSDRLLHYHTPAPAARRRGMSAYGICAALAATCMMGLLAGQASGTIPDDLIPLTMPCAFFCGLVALLGCALASFQHERRRTFLWLGVLLTMIALGSFAYAGGYFQQLSFLFW
jgi:drug/metabolite transporter (DMT)-like permease